MRARAVALMRISLFIKRGKAAYEVVDGVYVAFTHPGSVADVFEECVIPYMVTRGTVRL